MARLTDYILALGIMGAAVTCTLLCYGIIAGTAHLLHL